MSSKGTPRVIPARIHLLAAKEAPFVVVIRRKPSRLCHIMCWNTKNDHFEYGSWFRGRIYEKRSDVSFDGKYMVYLAMGSSGETWTGVCQPPFLKTYVDWENCGTWHGGGVFTANRLLEINAGYAESVAFEAIEKAGSKLPFRCKTLENPGYGEDEGVLYPRLERDGFRRIGPLGEEVVVPGIGYHTVCKNDPGWVVRPSRSHPELRLRYRGYSSGHGRIFEWDLPEHPGLLDDKVCWATYDSLGQLIVAREGILYRYQLKDLLDHKPSAVIDLEPLERPAPKTI